MCIRDRFRALGTLGMAAKQIVAVGTPKQLADAVTIVDNARKELYRLLGSDAVEEVVEENLEDDDLSADQ